MPVRVPGDTGPRHSEGAVSSTSAEDGEPNVRTFASAVLQESYFHEPRGRAGSHTGPASPLPSPPAPLLSPRLPSSLPTVQELPPARAGVGSQIGVEEGVNDRMGYLVKQGHRIKNWKRRWFVLSGRFLTYYRKAGEADPAGV